MPELNDVLDTQRHKFMDEEYLRKTCTKCSKTYRSCARAERHKASVGHAGLCEACIRSEQEQAINDALAECAAKMLQIDARFKSTVRH